MNINNDANKRKKKRKNRFLQPGFQPTAIAGDNIGYYHGSTFYEGVPPDTLPILDLSVILSPGQYCKRSSWTNSNSQGTKSGVDAAQRLVEGRRELMDVIRHELLSSLSRDEMSSSSNMDYSDSNLIEENDGYGEDIDTVSPTRKIADETKTTTTRKIYSITGHGVPKGLLCQMLNVARDWLLHKHNDIDDHDPSSSISSPASTANMNMKITFTNTPNSTITLNQHQIQVINSNGITSTLLPSNIGLPTNWEHDFEMYMVIMDRIGSRLASHASKATTTNDEEELSTLTLGTSGSIITPSLLQQWNVTIMKGEALPLSLLPHGYYGQSIPIGTSSQGSSSSKQGRRRVEYTKHHDHVVPKLTLELCNPIQKKKNKTSEMGLGGDCGTWNVILRLQDNGDTTMTSTDESGIVHQRRDPVSLVFEGEYVAL